MLNKLPELQISPAHCTIKYGQIMNPVKKNSCHRLAKTVGQHEVIPSTHIRSKGIINHIVTIKRKGGPPIRNQTKINGKGHAWHNFVLSHCKIFGTTALGAEGRRTQRQWPPVQSPHRSRIKHILFSYPALRLINYYQSCD